MESLSLFNLGFTGKSFHFSRSSAIKAAFDTRAVTSGSSGSHKWYFPCSSQEDALLVNGNIPIRELELHVELTLCVENTQLTWLELKLHSSILDDVKQWSSYFSGNLVALPKLDLKLVATKALQSARIINISKPGEKYLAFCKLVTSSEFVVRMAQLRKIGCFPAITSKEDGLILASQLVFRWNVLMVQESEQRLFVFQGVTSCDAVYIPGLNILIIVCHITLKDIIQCFEILVRKPEFEISTPRSFLGYLVNTLDPIIVTMIHYWLCNIYVKRMNFSPKMHYFLRVMKHSLTLDQA